MIFFDNNATTPLLPEVIDAMLLDLDGIPKNPSSITKYGRMAKQMLITARKTIADYFQVFPEEVIFTSGGTESNHFLINGFYQARPGHIITTAIEHHSVLFPLNRLNADVTYLKVGSFGAPTLNQIEKAIKPQTKMIVLSGANNETGALNAYEEIAELADHHNISLLLDGVCLLGKHKLSPLNKKISGTSFSGHKCHGPKGVGIAIVNKKYKIPPLLQGGHQERNLRAGTENLAGILGFAKAIELIPENPTEKLSQLRDYFEKEVKKLFPTIEINGQGPRIPNTSNIFFDNIDAQSLLIHLDQNNIIASLGSACSAGTLEPSHVLLEMGLSNRRAQSSLRFSFSRLNTISEIDQAILTLKNFSSSRRELIFS